MPLNSTFSERGLGFNSYIAPPGAVTGVSIASTYSSGYTLLVSWTLPSDANLGSVWIEWSFDGGTIWSSAVQLAANATSASNSATGSQSVRARIRCLNTSLIYGAYSTSPVLTVPPDPVTTFTATNNATPGTVDLAWVNPTGTTSLLITREINGVPTTFGSYPSVSAVDVPGSSFDVSYTIIVGNAGGFAPPKTITVRTQPKVPTGVSFTASNPGNLTLTATGVSQSNFSNYESSLSTTGVFNTPVSTGSTPNRSWTTAVDGTTYAARVRTVDTFGQVSAWATSGNAVGVNDMVGPVVNTPTAVWSNGIPGFTVSWTTVTDALSSVSSVQIQVSYDNGASISGTLAATAAAGSVNHTMGTTNSQRGNLVYFRMKATDSLGNISYSAWRTVRSKPYGTFSLLSQSTYTWSANQAAWRTDTFDLVSGVLSGDTTWGTQTGYWFYGSQIANTCVGFAPDSCSILLIRQGTSGSTTNHEISTHGSTTRPTSAPATANAMTGPVIAGNGSVDYAISAAARTAMGNGTADGFALTPDANYHRLMSKSDNVYSGLLTVTFT